MATIKEDSFIGRVKAVCISKKKGTRKQEAREAVLEEDFGIIDDAHAGSHRQVSLLAEESIEKMRSRGLKAGFGDFGENIVTEGIDLKSLPLTARIKMGEDVILEITQIGKVCVSRCAIYHEMGDCVMPREGIFARVLKGGAVKAGDRLMITIDHTVHSY